MGFRNGYITVGKGHPWSGLDWTELSQLTRRCTRWRDMGKQRARHAVCLDSVPTRGGSGLTADMQTMGSIWLLWSKMESR